MYIPKHFEVTDKAEIFSFIERNAFGQLVSHVDGRLFSTHIPFLVSEDKVSILGHLAKQNPQHSELNGQEVLITLQGPHGYISPAWYATPGVPTWNYQAVHLYGHCNTFTDPDRLRSVIDDLTRKNEFSFAEPCKPEYADSMLGAIVGIEVTITEIQCQYKLSQYMSAQDRSQVIAHLTTQGSNELAEAMERNRR